MKKYISFLIVSTVLMVLTACGSSKNDEITVVSREDGSGTRGAFVEIFGILVKDGETKTDMTYEEAIIANKADAVMTNVSKNKNAIGYISLGSLNDTVKPVKINGVMPSSENILNKSYEVSRPFNIAFVNESNDLANDFIKFILSKEGQNIVSKSYIKVNENAPSYEKSNPSGKLSIGGSTSVSPLMEKLKEAYITINPNVTIDIQSTGSTAGMTGTIDKTLDIGMASRKLKTSEKEVLKSIEIAYDGLAVVVNNENEINNLTKEEVRKIFVGEVTFWSDLQ